jgi:DNA-binding MarR family transcriptional regulator
MVKKLDEIPWPETLDHIGWLLWRVTQRWKQEFDEGLVALGYPWAVEARANIVMHIGRSGIRQAELVRRMRLSKQAVQQLLDELVADGIVVREPDPEDRRGKLIAFTGAGRKFLADANIAKRRIEAEYRAALGDRRFGQLVDALTELNPKD